jgi:hypothetical protein
MWRVGSLIKPMLLSKRDEFMKYFYFLCISVSLLATICPAQEYAAIDLITIEKFKPSLAEVGASKTIDTVEPKPCNEHNNEDNLAYVVKIYSAIPAASAGKPRLLIGDEYVPFGTFSQGIYVKILNRNKLTEMAGKPVKIMITAPVPHEPLLAAHFPSLHQTHAAQMSEREPGTLEEVLAH